MKSRTSCFNKTVFQKNLTRFAPAWGLYTICLLMGLFLMLDGDSATWLPSNMAECVQIMSVITPCYAFLVAQLLFGDLFNTRMCNALHALPMRRETWFVTNVAAGIWFHLIPTAVMSGAAVLIMLLGSYSGGWVTGLYWLLGTNLQYLCFFGIGVFSAMCTGSRFAMTVVYGILNFASVILAWLVDTLYMPMFFGMKINTDPYLLFCPVGQMIEESFITVERTYIQELGRSVATGVVVDGNFVYYFICAAVGVLLMAAALQMYRKRRLECAGDFMAVKGLEPVFHVAYSLMVGSVFAFVVDDLFGMGDGLLFLFIGLAVGYFTGRMLLMRNVRVFQKKGWLGLGILLACFGATLIVAKLDLFGVVGWVPKAEQVESVMIAYGHYNYHESEITLEDLEEIQKVIAIHQEGLLERNEGNMVAVSTDVTLEEITAGEPQAVDSSEVQRFTVPLTIEYHLKDGRMVCRYYYIWNDTENGQNIQRWFSSPECVFGEEGDVETLAGKFSQVTVQESYYGEETIYRGEENMEGLLEAMFADCEAGTMVQDWDYHRTEELVCWMSFKQGQEYRELRVYSGCVNTLNWLSENGFDVDEILELYKNG